MIGVFVEFAYGDAFDADRLAAIAAQGRERFVGLPELRAKIFTIDAPNRRATNLYLWASADAAKAFFSEATLDHVTTLYGVEPTLRYVDVCALVDNGPDAAGSPVNPLPGGEAV